MGASVKQRSSASGVTLSLGPAPMSPSLIVDLVPTKVPGSKESSKYKMICPVCTEPTGLTQSYACNGHPDDHKGYQVADIPRRAQEIDGKLVEVSAAEITTVKTGSAPPAESNGEKEKPVVSLTVHPAGEVAEATLPAELAYRIRPDTKATSLARQLYGIIRDQVASGKVAFVGEITLRETTHLVRLGVFQGQLILQTLVRPDDLAPVDEFDVPKADAKTKKMATALVEAMTQTFDAHQYRNQARERAEALRDAKAQDPTATVAVATPKKKADNSNDLAALLEASLAQAKQSAA